jgi:fructose-specific phosphotransferase system IIA component
MKITELLIEKCVFLNVKANKKEEVWSLLANSLKEAGAVRDVEGYLADVHCREEKGTTGIGFGVAIPHAKSAAVALPALAMARLDAGIDVASLDGTKADIFFQIAAPINGEDVHLSALSRLARMLIHSSFLDALRQAKTPADVIAVIRERDEAN